MIGERRAHVAIGPRAVIAAVALTALAAGCGDKVQGGLTGVDVRVTFAASLPVAKLEFAGFLKGDAAFERKQRPLDDRELDPEGENLIILLADTTAGSQLFVRVDGLDLAGSMVGSTGGKVTLQQSTIASLQLSLGDAPRECGDGNLHPSAEECDDGNATPGDGCNSDCVIEDGWQCDDGQPTHCRKCGDGICSAGEDACSCADDCTGATCGDGLCCPAAGEACNCPDDCPPTCGDDVCCASEVEQNCAECGDCGNGTCETAKGEDHCSCPDDCTVGDPFVPDNGVCCDSAGETANNSQQDCCPAGIPNNGFCCVTDTVQTDQADCCPTKAQCFDGVCCPGAPGGECEQDCCDTTCEDGVCCSGRGEGPSSCPFDCCQSCSTCTGGGCCADVCGPGGCQLSCNFGCDCSFDCRSAGCDTTCTGSPCKVECTGAPDKCTVACNGPTTNGDGGVITEFVPSPLACVCHGDSCVLTCNGGPPLQCPADSTYWVCDERYCP